MDIPDYFEILLLEDNHSDADLIILEIQDISTEVVIRRAVNKAEFIDALHTFSPHIILADFALPGYDAISAYRDMINMQKDIPFILISGTVTDELAVQLIKEEGIDDFILKDRIKRLPEAIKNVLKKRQLEYDNKKALEKLMKNQGILEEAQETAKIGSWEMDVESGAMIWTNQMFKILCLENNGSVVDLDIIYEYVHPEDKPLLDELVELARSGGEGQRFLRIFTKKGEEKVVHAICKQSRDSNKTIKLYGTVQDVTVSKRNEIALENLKNELEVKVKERTHELSVAHEVLLQHNTMLTQSINYAKLIQRAHLPERRVLYNLLPESFIIYEPRDVVSGDFYWIGEKNNHIVIAVGDCTGHGVPAALLTMVGVSQLNTIIHDNGITDPGSILDELHLAVRKAFRYDSKPDEHMIEDGMDMAICSYDMTEGILYFAGARRPLFYIADNESNLVSPVRRSIGETFLDFDLDYKTVKIDFPDNASFYMYSDGYVDQFGGDLNRRYTNRKFLELLANNMHLSMREQKKMIKEEFRNWKSKEKQIDDVVVLGFKLNTTI